MSFTDLNKYFFIGIAGSGMSALAQFLKFLGKNVKGSDRLFNSQPNHPIRNQLEKLGIKTFLQGSAKLSDSQIVIVSTAIESSVPEYQQAKKLGIPIVHRSELLADLSKQFFSIAISGTSGKSTTTALIFHFLQKLNKLPSLISGSALISIQKKGFIGNAYFQKNSNILVFEADESDGSLINYKPDIALILNLSKDHKEIDVLKEIFEKFAFNSKFVVKNANDSNLSHIKADLTFGCCKPADLYPTDFQQNDNYITFKIQNVSFRLNTFGFHNALNVASASAVGKLLNIRLKDIAFALKDFEGISRRLQLIYNQNNIKIFDDYAHNPHKIQAAIKAVKPLGKRLIVFFQPHGFKPLEFFYNELIEVFENNLNQSDYLFLAPVFYAGGTVKPNKTSEDLVKDIKKLKNVFLLSHKNQFPEKVAQIIRPNDVVLIMGARDPDLSLVAQQLKNLLSFQ